MDLDGNPHSPDEESTSPDEIPKNRRSLKSLHILATRFVGLLQDAEHGLLDLKDAVKLLAVEKKRRIYDITNVLEGVGLIVKISKSMIKWNGTVPGEHAFRVTNRVIELRAELKDLEQKESMLDQQKFWVEQSTTSTKEDCSDLTYVNHDDICNCFSGDTLLAIQAPCGTKLDVPIPKAVRNCPTKYQIYLKSINGPIDVVLLNKLTVDSVPVVLPVPPSKELLRKAKSAVATSDETESSIKRAAKSRRTVMEDMLHLQSSSRSNTAPNRTDASELRDLSKELQDLLRPTKAIMNAELLKNLLASEGFSPLHRSPLPSEQEHIHTLDESEGILDIPMLNV
ncbi:transcription factor E2F5 [Gasterosteus aculeatus]|uniref:transcription factor E2F4-like n=1 Tax=Gasterosteus aculeatus aculeatus TaxID=481459 RepID=UPI001A999876|nr:transcription factor E2F4-like [Gasterosteus aculeatus aculeatus]